VVRTATAAHPLCVCGKLKRSYCTREMVPYTFDETGFPTSLAWLWVERREDYTAAECPMHCPEPRTAAAISTPEGD